MGVTETNKNIHITKNNGKRIGRYKSQSGSIWTASLGQINSDHEKNIKLSEIELEMKRHEKKWSWKDRIWLRACAEEDYLHLPELEVVFTEDVTEMDKNIGTCKSVKQNKWCNR